VVAVEALDGAAVDPVPAALDAVPDPDPQPDTLAITTMAITQTVAYPPKALCRGVRLGFGMSLL
jgi:hypothetical protein